MVTSYGFGGLNPLYFLSSVILLISLMTLLFLIFSSKYILKPLLITLFVVSSFTAYFMDSYSVVIDSEMIRNSLQTNLKESSDLFSFKLILYVIFLAILPRFFYERRQ